MERGCGKERESKKEEGDCEQSGQCCDINFNEV